MKEVSCRIVVAAVEAAEFGGVAAEEIFRGVGIPPEQLLNVRNRIDWDSYAVIMDNYAAALRTDENVRRVSREYARVKSLRYIAQLAQLIASPLQLYRFHERWLGPSNFSHIVATPGVLSGNVWQVELHIPEPYAPSRSFLVATAGVYESLPIVLGLPAAHVDAEITPRHAVYRIHLPPSGTFWSRGWRRIKGASGVFTMAGMLRRQHDELNASLELATRQKQDFERLLATISDGVALLAEDGRVVFANTALRRTLGVADLAALRQRPLGAWVRSEDTAAWEQLLDPRSPRADGDIRFQRADGAEVVCAVARHESVLFADQETRMVVLRDVTEQRALERALAAAGRREREQIAHDLHDSVGQVFAGAALKTGLLAKKLAQRGAAEAAQAEEVCALLQSGSRQLRDLAHSLSPVTLASHGFAPALRRLAATSAELFGIACEFKTVDGQTALVAPGTANEAYRIAQESIANAVRHGRATRVTLAWKPEADGWWLEIVDNGAGFAANTTEVSDGMGLKIMRHRAASFGGRIEFGAAPSRGARVRCFVPVVADVNDPGPSDASPAAERREPCRRNSWRIVVADDHPVFRSGLVTMLRQEPDFSVVAEAATPDALESACNRERPDALVTDLLFGNELVFPVLRRIRAGLPDLRIVVISMFPETSYGRPARTAGADVFLNKQEGPEAVRAAVRGE